MLKEGALAACVRGEKLWLLPERALFWERESALILSDIHIGKSGHFRKYGIAIPYGVIERDLTTLSGLLTQCSATRIIVVGDLTHAEVNHEWTVFARWRAQQPNVSVDLVTGNHDRFDSKVYKENGIEEHSPSYDIPPFTFAHKPGGGSAGLFEIAGHVHPSCIVRGKARQRERLPCFLVRGASAILPAFGSFTGTYTIKPTEQDRVFVVADTNVFQLYA